MTDRGSHEVDLQTVDQAAAWFARRLAGNMSPVEELQLQRWLASSPVHSGHWDALTRTFVGIDPLRDDPEFNAMRAETVGSIRHRSAGWPRRLYAGVAAAAVVLICCIALLAGLPLGSRWGKEPGIPLAEIESAKGQRSRFALEDGTTVLLDADSALHVDFARETRNVRLDRGRVLFHVAKNARRPFIVTAGDKNVTALGTEFTMEVKPGGIKVMLLEGAVKVQELSATNAVRAVTMIPGQLLLARDDAPWQLRREDAERLLEWTHGKLVFEDATLADVIDEMNRYLARPILLSGVRAPTRRLTAVLDAGDIETFIVGVETMKLAKISRRPDGSVLVSDR